MKGEAKALRWHRRIIELGSGAQLLATVVALVALYPLYEKAGLERQIDELTKTVETVKGETSVALQEKERLHSEVVRLAQESELRKHDSLQAEEQLSRKLAATNSALDDTMKALEKARSELEGRRRDLDHLQSELKDTKRFLGEARRDAYRFQRLLFAEGLTVHLNSCVSGDRVDFSADIRECFQRALDSQTARMSTRNIQLETPDRLRLVTSLESQAADLDALRLTALKQLRDLSAIVPTATEGDQLKHQRQVAAAKSPLLRSGVLRIHKLMLDFVESDGR
jgi:DNA repair exonuclease SbcCD ATPase subunit